MVVMVVVFCQPNANEVNAIKLPFSIFDFKQTANMQSLTMVNDTDRKWTFCKTERENRGEKKKIEAKRKN